MKQSFTGIRGWVVTGLLCVVAIMVLVGCTGALGGAAAATATASADASQAPTEGAEQAVRADPQRLLIPRWFLSELTLDGENMEVAPDQQAVTIQFQEDGKVNGTGGCNDFSATYSATPDGKMAFGPVVSTKMACDPGMQLENAYFQALSKVQTFSTEDGLKLFSADGKTTITFRMPPK